MSHEKVPLSIWELDIFLAANRAANVNIYVIARLVQLLQQRNEPARLTDDELEQLYSAFIRARKGNAEILNHPAGYGLIRLYMLVQHFIQLHRDTLNNKDLEIVRAAAEFYRNQKNYGKLWSILETCTAVGVKLPLRLTPEDLRRLNAARAAPPT